MPALPIPHSPVAHANFEQLRRVIQTNGFKVAVESCDLLKKHVLLSGPDATRARVTLKRCGWVKTWY